MKEKNPYLQFDLPRIHLSENGNHYTIPIVGTGRGGEVAILSRQARGLKVAGKAIELELQKQRDDGGYTTRLLASAAMNSAWYTYGKDAGMRRIIPLPVLAERTDEGDWRQDYEGLLDITKGYMDSAYRQTLEYAQYRALYKHDEPTRKYLGKTLGVTSLSLACLDVVDTTQSATVFEVQDQVREAAIRTLTDAREFERTLGVYPSMAQIGNEASELMLYVRRKAPVATRELFEQAITLVDDEGSLDK